MPTRPLANLKCDKLRISDAYCTSKSSRCAKRVMRSILGTLTCFICFSSYQLLWPWGKSHWSLCKARLPLCCIGLMLPTTALGSIRPISDCTDHPTHTHPMGLPVHFCELRRGRLWIAEVVPAFYRNGQDSAISVQLEIGYGGDKGWQEDEGGK